MLAGIRLRMLRWLCGCLVLLSAADASAWTITFTLRVPTISGILVMPDVRPVEPSSNDVQLRWDPAKSVGQVSSTTIEPPSSLLLNVQLLNLTYPVRSSTLSFKDGAAVAVMRVEPSSTDLPRVTGVVFKPGKQINGFIAVLDNPSAAVRVTGFGFSTMPGGGACYHPTSGVYDLKLVLEGDRILGGTATKPGEPYSTSLIGRFVDECNHQLYSEGGQFTEPLDKGSREISFRIAKVQVTRRSGDVIHGDSIKSFGTGTSDLCVHFRIDAGTSVGEIIGAYVPGATDALLSKAVDYCEPLWLTRSRRR